MNYFLEFKKWVDQNTQAKSQVISSAWDTAINTWNQEEKWKKALKKTLFDLTEKVPSGSPLWVVHRWIASGGLPILYQLPLYWDRLKTLINSWQSKLSNGQKLIEEVRELIHQHTENANHAINSAEKPIENNLSPNLKKGFYVANSQQRTIVVKGKVLYQLRDFEKMNEQLNSLTLILKPK